MGELPSGTVTFLFTDIEGSTRLLTRLRERYVDVLAEHQRVLRAAFKRHDGHEVHTEGDAFFVAFARASDAVAAAVSAQRALGSEHWPQGVDVRVRMGIHTGEATIRDGDYVGLDVHRAARICSAAHGGQILVSSSTHELVGDELAPDVAFSDLGQHRLKDLDRPEHLFQLVAAELPARFPAVRSLGSMRSWAAALAPAPNRTIGRAREVGAVAKRLRTGSARLLTLTGPGGVGKTRLAVEAARVVEPDFADGACFLSLAPVQRPQDVAGAIVKSLDIIALSGESAERAIERFLAAKHLLLVADNCEHLLAAAPMVGRLLEACPGLTVLATSRAPLGLQAEQRYPVSPLALPDSRTPDDPDSLASVDSVALFCERAGAHDAEFVLHDGNSTAVADICRRLDGLPLAIELAAARCGLLSAAEIAGRLATTLGALGGAPRDAPARQQTLWATIDWSHELLSDEEKACFARFAVFAGGASVDAAEAITGANLETLDLLVAKNLLVRRRQPDSRTRLGMLETVRAYALERLAATPDRDALRERHYRHYLALAQSHGTERALWAKDGKEHLARLDADIENLHAALGWAVTQANAKRALMLATALGRYWLMRNRDAEAVEWINHALNLPGADAHRELRVRALCSKSWSGWSVGRGRAEQAAVMVEAEAVARELAEPLIVSEVLVTRAAQAAVDNQLDVARALADEALRWANAEASQWAAARAEFARAMVARGPAERGERVDRAASLLEAVGNVYQLAQLFSDAAYGALCDGSDHDAIEFLGRALPITRELDHPYQSMLLRGNFALAALLTGDTEAAREAFREELTLCRQLVILPIAQEGLQGLAAVAVLDNNLTRAARLAGAAAAHRYGQSDDPVDTRLRATFFEPARTRCRNDEWNAAAREGAALSFQDAIAYALEEPRPRRPQHASNRPTTADASH